jgi:hypothetical protein
MNKDIDKCLEEVDFEDVKSILKRPQRIPRSNTDEIEVKKQKKIF